MKVFSVSSESWPGLCENSLCSWVAHDLWREANIFEEKLICRDPTVTQAVISVCDGGGKSKRSSKHKGRKQWNGFLPGGLGLLVAESGEVSRILTGQEVVPGRRDGISIVGGSPSGVNHSGPGALGKKIKFYFHRQREPQRVVSKPVIWSET